MDSTVDPALCSRFTGQHPSAVAGTAPYRASHKPYRPAASKRAPESPPVDVSLRADAFETPTQQPFATVHAREEASMCDPSQGHREVHAAAPPIVQAPVSCDAAPGIRFHICLRRKTCRAPFSLRKFWARRAVFAKGLKFKSI